LGISRSPRRCGNLSEDESRSFEKTALAFLKVLGFTPVGYYPYSHASDVSGYLEAKPPFKVHVKAMVEIARIPPTRASVEGFHKLVKGALADRAMLICQTPLTQLGSDVQLLVDKLGIEFFDQAVISSELKKRNVSRAEIQTVSKIYDVIGPPALVKSLPEIALQKIPDGMREAVEKLHLKPWQVFEQAVYSTFHYCYNLSVKELGEDALFEHEPEGLAIVEGLPSTAFIYECKSAGKSYIMTSDHELRYGDYIVDKKKKTELLERSELKYFVIVAPEFSGDIEERRERIFKKTQVLVVFMPADVLRLFSEWVCPLQSNLKRLVDFGDIFRLEEVVVSKERVESYIKKFEDTQRTRW
jgi:hypothetical protein